MFGVSGKGFVAVGIPPDPIFSFFSHCVKVVWFVPAKTESGVQEPTTSKLGNYSVRNLEVAP